MTDVINIFGRVNKVLNAAMDSDAQTFEFPNTSHEEAKAISAILLTGFMNLLRTLIEKSRTSTLDEDDKSFHIDLVQALTNREYFDSNKLYSYHPETETLFLQLPSERVEQLITNVSLMHEHLNIIATKGAKGRVELPGHGNTICYMFQIGDSSNTIGDKALAINTSRFIDCLMQAHGFKNVVAIDLKQSPPMIGIKKTALDAVLRLEKLELQTQRDGSGEFPNH